MKASARQTRSNAGLARKLRPQLLVARLSLEQRQTLERWLVHDNLRYADAQKRVLREFGLKVGPSTLCNFYQQVTRRKIQPPREVRVEVIIPIKSDDPIRLRVVRAGAENTTVKIARA